MLNVCGPARQALHKNKATPQAWYTCRNLFTFRKKNNMQTKIIELKQAPVILVELEERPTKVEDSLVNGFIYTDEKGYVESFYLDDICEDSKLVGILSDLTEEQFAECVDYKQHSGLSRPEIRSVKLYKDYPSGLFVNIASESFYSLLESENVYTENPYGEKSPAAVVMVGGMELLNTSGAIAKANRRRIEQWQEAQQRTIDAKRTVVLVRKEG